MKPFEGILAQIIMRNVNLEYYVAENPKDVVLTGLDNEITLRCSVVLASLQTLPNDSPNVPAALIIPAIEYENMDPKLPDQDGDKYYLNWMCVGDVVE